MNWAEPFLEKSPPTNCGVKWNVPIWHYLRQHHLECGLLIVAADIMNVTYSQKASADTVLQKLSQLDPGKSHSLFSNIRSTI